MKHVVINDISANEIKNNDIILDSYNFGKFKIIDFNKDKFKIKFIDTGYKCNVNIKEIRTGKIRDCMAISLCNVARLGKMYKDIKKEDPELCKALHEKWASMILRCYSPNTKYYELYGGKGIKVSNSWLTFTNFYKDAIELSGFDRTSVINGYVTLDKDKLQIDIDNKVYSKKTCCWLTMKEQSKYVDHVSCKKEYMKKVKCIFPDNNSITFYGIRKFARKHNLSQSAINKCLNGKQITHAGCKFEYCSE